MGFLTEMLETVRAIELHVSLLYPTAYVLRGPVNGNMKKHLSIDDPRSGLQIDMDIRDDGKCDYGKKWKTPDETIEWIDKCFEQFEKEEGLR